MKLTDGSEMPDIHYCDLTLEQSQIIDKIISNWQIDQVFDERLDQTERYFWYRYACGDRPS